VKLATLTIIAACGGVSSPPVASPGAPIGVNARPASGGLGTIVATLPAGTSAAIVQGPFAISAINPGHELELAIGTTGAAGGACSGALAWFEYSGGGVTVGAGQTLCARNVAHETATHGFSGRGDAP
jgi:hypothetical protein